MIEETNGITTKYWHISQTQTHTVTPDAMVMFVMILMAMMLIVITKIPQKKSSLHIDLSIY